MSLFFPHSPGGSPVTVMGMVHEVRDVCCGCRSNTPGAVHFAVLPQVKPLTPWLRPFSHLGSAIENIRRDRRARQQGVAVQGAAQTEDLVIEACHWRYRHE